MIRFSLLPVILAVGLPVLAAEPEPFTVRSGPAQTALLELFTSEGCSSCPPAEKWLSGFEQRRELWRDVVPVVWHVDYWDNLGWVDRFAFKSNTSRQERYAAAWQSQSIYTPGFVLNGMEWRDWNRPLDFAKSAKSDAGVLELSQSAKETFTLRYTPPKAFVGAFDVTVAWLGNDLESDVRRGENAGRKLRHNFVVLRTASAPLHTTNGVLSASIPLPTPTERDSKHLSVVAWVSSHGQQAPVQAVGGWFPSK